MIKVYLVGGALRDMYLGITPKDLDYVVVGSNPEEMLAYGFTKVGTDFPVFLHPESKEEYALARTDRKVGKGYKGFTCEWEGVTIEEDLSRRDLTINSIALEIGYPDGLFKGSPVFIGGAIDPYNGLQDIKDKVLRPTTEAFKEDPLRVLRSARFMARLPEFTSDTEDRLFKYSESLESELQNNLVPERVWLETEKALSEIKPSSYFNWLAWFNVFSVWGELCSTDQKSAHHPEGDVGIHTGMAMDYASKTYKDTEITFACLTHDFGKPLSQTKYGNAHGHEKEGLPVINEFCDKWKVPNRYRELALLVCEYHTKIHGILGSNGQNLSRPKSVMKLFEDTSALSKTGRFEKILKSCIADSRGRGGTAEEIKQFESKPYPQAEYLRECLSATLKVDTKIISKEMLANGKQGVMIGEAIRVKRIEAIRGVQKLWK